jgi:PRTRC genetic system protein C
MPKIENIKRVFKYNGKILDDPDPKLKPREVLEVFSRLYPALTNGEIDGPHQEGNEETWKLHGKTNSYNVRGNYGTKG